MVNVVNNRPLMFVDSELYMYDGDIFIKIMGLYKLGYMGMDNQSIEPSCLQNTKNGPLVQYSI